MPFAADGTYIPPTGAENAAPGQIIRSVTWNTIFTDIATALTTLGHASPAVAAPTTLSAPLASYTVTATDSVVLVSATVGTIVMPLSSTRTGVTTIAGAAAGFFATHNCVLLPTSTDKFSSLSSITLATDFRVVTLYALASGGYIVT